MFDPVFCNACGETNEIGSLIGGLTNDCPNCARPVLFKQQLANKGSHQPATITGLALVLRSGDTFRSGKNHIDFPDMLLYIPKNCVGIVEKYQNNNTEGTVSVLHRDTVNSRRLVRQADQTQFHVSANVNRVRKLIEFDDLPWNKDYGHDGSRNKNRVKIIFTDKEEAIRFYNLLVLKDCVPIKNWN